MLEPGESELEIYFTNEMPELDPSSNININTLKLEVELELGMSVTLEVSFYNVLKEYPVFDNGTFIERKLKYDEYKLRFKYKIYNIVCILLIIICFSLNV